VHVMPPSLKLLFATLQALERDQGAFAPIRSINFEYRL
jgi:hypothetical protein